MVAKGRDVGAGADGADFDALLFIAAGLLLRSDLYVVERSGRREVFIQKKLMAVTGLEALLLFGQNLLIVSHVNGSGRRRTINATRRVQGSRRHTPSRAPDVRTIVESNTPILIALPLDHLLAFSTVIPVGAQGAALTSVSSSQRVGVVIEPLEAGVHWDSWAKPNRRMGAVTEIGTIGRGDLEVNLAGRGARRRCRGTSGGGRFPLCGRRGPLWGWLLWPRRRQWQRGLLQWRWSSYLKAF